MNSDHINALYPATTPVQTEKEADQTEADESTTGEPTPTDLLYPKADEQTTTGNKHALEDNKGTVEDVLYGDSERVQLSTETDLTVIGETPEQQQALTENLSAMASTAGATQGDIHDLVSHANKILLTGETPDPTATMSSLYEIYGASLNSRLQDAQDLVKSYPELHDWLESTGLGDDQVIVSRIIQLTETDRSQSRLKTLRSKK